MTLAAIAGEPAPLTEAATIPTDMQISADCFLNGRSLDRR
jgi:hypothetical protein